MSTTTFHALFLNHVALETGTPPAPVGELAHAASYAAIRATDPDLAARMHDAQERAAFSLSPLSGYERNPRNGAFTSRYRQIGEFQDVPDDDLPVSSERQLDPDANYMAAFTAKNPADRDAFAAHRTGMAQPEFKWSGLTCRGRASSYLA